MAEPDAATLAASKAQPSSSIGQWSAPIPGAGGRHPHRALHTGKVLFWSYDLATYHVVSQSSKGVFKVKAQHKGELAMRGPCVPTTS